MPTTYTPAQLAHARQVRDVTGPGIAYREWLEGPHGAGFALLREPQHTPADVAAAKQWLRARRDVVALYVYTPARPAAAEALPHHFATVAGSL